MHTICLLSLKGGAGKSTVVQSLSVCAVQNGQKTLVVELDPQGTLKNWSNRREACEPRVIQTLPQSLGDVLTEARDNDVNWVFLDTPGHNASTAAAAAEYADIILIPCKIQSVKDFDSVLASLAEAKRVDKPAYVLMTQVPPNARKFVRKRQLEIQKHYDVAVLSKHLSRRVDFEYCDAKGLSASEMNPSGEAAAEIERLFALIQSIFIMLEPRNDAKADVLEAASSIADEAAGVQTSTTEPLAKPLISTPSQTTPEPADRAIPQSVALPASVTQTNPSIPTFSPTSSPTADPSGEPAEEKQVVQANTPVSLTDFISEREAQAAKDADANSGVDRLIETLTSEQAPYEDLGEDLQAQQHQPSSDDAELDQQPLDDPDDRLDIPSFVKSYNRLRADK